MQETKSIVATNLYDMLLEVQTAVKQGFVLSELNEHYPQAFIGMYTCGMVKDTASTSVSLELDDVQKESLKKTIEESKDEYVEINQDVAEKKTTVAKPATTKRNTKKV